MKFRRSTGSVKNVGSAYTGGDPQRLRRGRIIRLVLVFGVIVFGVLIVNFMRSSWITADGIVVGDLAEVSPVDIGRIVKVYGHCLQYVSRGQPIADLENESITADARQKIKELEINAAEANADEEIAQAEAAAARAYHDAQEAVHAQTQAVFNAQTQLLKGKYVASLVWEKAKYDVVQSEANALAAQYLVQTKLDDARKAKLMADLTRERIAQLGQSPALMGTYHLLAAKEGYLTQCNATVGAVVNSGAALYQIFNPNDAYIVAFVDPTDATRVHHGDRLDVTITGLEGAVHGVVSGFFPELSGLPDSLTRYFWQREKWSQFEPLRIDFADLSDKQREAIRAGAQVSISLFRPPTTGLLGGIGRALTQTPDK